MTTMLGLPEGERDVQGECDEVLEVSEAEERRKGESQYREIDRKIKEREREGRENEEDATHHRPEIVVAETLPKQLRGESLTVVHRRLGVVVADDTVDDELDLVVREVTLGAPAGLGLRRRGGEQKEGKETDDEGEDL